MMDTYTAYLLLALAPYILVFGFGIAFLCGSLGRRK